MTAPSASSNVGRFRVSAKKAQLDPTKRVNSFLTIPGEKYPIEVALLLASSTVRLKCIDMYSPGGSHLPPGLYMYRVCNDFLYVPAGSSARDSPLSVDPSMCFNCNGSDAPDSVDQFVRGCNGEVMVDYNPWASGVTDIILFGAILITDGELSKGAQPPARGPGTMNLSLEYLTAVEITVYRLFYYTAVRPFLPLLLLVAAIVIFATASVITALKH